jgi:hypothetical protein
MKRKVFTKKTKIFDFVYSENTPFAYCLTFNEILFLRQKYFKKIGTRLPLSRKIIGKQTQQNHGFH